MSAETEPASSLSASSLPDTHSLNKKKRERERTVTFKRDRGAAHSTECITKHFCILFMVKSKACALIAPKRRGGVVSRCEHSSTRGLHSAKQGKRWNVIRKANIQ